MYCVELLLYQYLYFIFRRELPAMSIMSCYLVYYIMDIKVYNYSLLYQE